MFRFITFTCLFTSLIFIFSCSNEPEQQKIRLGINPWPGYEFIYLASEKGYFKEEGLDVELVELASLADVKRVFEQERVDAMASTIIEAVEVAVSSDQQLDIVLIPDFSNGGDVIIANEPIQDISGLKGKKIGVELGLLGTYILSLALEKNELSFDDVTMINVEQLDAERQLKSGLIDAVVTYPPFSSLLLRDPALNNIFSSAEIPGDVIDVVVVRNYLIVNPKEWQEKFFKVWQKALDYANTNPDDAYRIMAEREGISSEEFAEALQGISVIEQDHQFKILGSEQLKNNIIKVCQTMYRTDTVNNKCGNINERINSIVY